MGTAIVLIVLAIIVGAIIYKMYRNRKDGKGSCSCGGNCGSCGHCEK